MSTTIRRTTRGAAAIGLATLLTAGGILTAPAANAAPVGSSASTTTAPQAGPNGNTGDTGTAPSTTDPGTPIEPAPSEPTAPTPPAPSAPAAPAPAPAPAPSAPNNGNSGQSNWGSWDYEDYEGPTWGDQNFANQFFRVGEAVNLPIAADNDNWSAIDYSIRGALPAGLTYDVDAKILTGMPTAAGAFNFKVVATATMTSRSSTSPGSCSTRTARA
jgi:hypothetical protein